MFLLLILATLFLVKPVFASTTDGTISTGDAWSEKIGWLNFLTTNGNVHVTDAGLTGYVWSNLYGWIKLNPTTSGVANNSEGTLSGSAWGENIGWIDFTGVIINSNGLFTGTANGDNTGVVNFSCANCLVQTDWRPASTRTSPPGGTPLPPGASSPPTPPYSIVLDNGAAQTNTTTIIITLRGSADTTYAWVSEDPNFVNNAIRVNFSPTSTEISIPFVLSPGLGQKTIYAKFCNQWGVCGNLISNSITLISPSLAPIIPPTSTTSSTAPKPPPTTIGGIIDDIATIIGKNLYKLFPFKLIPSRFARLYSELQLWVPNWFRPPQVAKIPVERFVSKATPLAFRGSWNYLDPKPINRFVFAPRSLAFRGLWDYLDPKPIGRFVFAPLPKEFLALEKKFPQVENILQKVGINRLTDLDKLKSVQMYLPGLTQAVTLNKPQIQPGKFGPETAIPVGELSNDLKDKIPTDIVFARSAGQMVDFKIALSLTAQNRPEQKISTVSGKTLQLTIRPEFPAKRVRGFLVFRSLKPQARVEVPLANLVSSLFFAEPVFAYNQEQPVEVEERLVLLEFEYTDPDGDGIFTANIESPVPAGEYEIITVIDYVDPEMGAKQIRLITVVDPEGYIFEKIGSKELRIPGAVVTLYHFNLEKKAYEEWPARDFQQNNPQTTGLSGSYSFLVPGGKYYLEAKAPNYLSYKGDEFIVDEGAGVHLNIELKTKYGWLKVLDWKTAALILVAMLLVYNFYKDRRREKQLSSRASRSDDGSTPLNKNN